MTLKEIDFDELDLGGVPNRVGPGRQAAPLTVRFSREITEADLAMPATEIQKPTSLVRIRDSHHALARVLATTGSEAEASIVTGFSLSRISVLKADPQFQELLEFYRSDHKDLVASIRERMLTLGLDALDEIRYRLEEKPESFSITQLRELARDLADRTGHAPAKGPTSVTNVHVELSERMQRARERVAAIPQGSKVIDHE